MKRILIAMACVGILGCSSGLGGTGIIGGTANAAPAKKPSKEGLKVALACVAEGMRYGLADTMTAEELADYCIEVAARLAAADYELP